MVKGHGGILVVKALKPFGINEIFTLSGGHIFPIYDACVKEGIKIVDFRHESSATFAAEGMAKLTRKPAVAVLTAGPGVTNGISAITTAWFNGSPLVVLGGRAPQNRWGSGSLQELNHIPIVDSITKLSLTSTTTASIPDTITNAISVALTPHRGPVFVDIPLDVLFDEAEAEIPLQSSSVIAPQPDEADLKKVAVLLAKASKPAIIAGSDIWWGKAWEALQNLVELLRIPTFTNGQARGCLTSDHELYFSRTRYKLKESDIVVVVGTPLDFRLSFGQFGDGEVIHIMDSPPANHPLGVRLNTSLIGDLKHILTELSNHLPEQVKDHETWIDELRSEEDAIRQDEHAQMTAAFSAKPIHPIALYGELNKYLDKDAVVIGDGGDFVSWAGKLINSYQPGCWMDPGPYGCLGTGLGYATAARIAHPDRQVVLLAGDGAFGFSAIELDTLVRHKIAVVIIVGNNGIWGLEKHPMKMLYGYDVAADLQPECHYDKLGIALGGGGETISSLKEFGPAIKRAFSAKVPYVLNILLDPQVAYPRTSSLA